MKTVGCALHADPRLNSLSLRCVAGGSTAHQSKRAKLSFATLIAGVSPAHQSKRAEPTNTLNSANSANSENFANFANSANSLNYLSGILVCGIVDAFGAYDLELYFGICRFGEGAAGEF